MKNIAVLGALFTSSLAQQLVTDARAPLKESVTKTKLGAIVQESYFDDFIEKIIHFPINKYIKDYSQQADHIKTLTEQIQKTKESDFNENQQPIYFCGEREDDPEPSDTFNFLPVFVADTTPKNPTATFKGMCFQEITMTYEQTSSSSFKLDMDFQNAKSLLCKELLFFGNTELYHFDLFFRKGKHSLTFNMPTVDEEKDVAFGGIKTFLFCEGVKDSIESVMNTLAAFIGGLGANPDKGDLMGSHVPKYMEDANVKFLGEAMGYVLEKRTTTKVEIDPATINSGDFFSIMRLDGLDPIVMYGTGSHAGHSTMALRFDGELYVVESQDAWYWPQHNIQRTPWATWIQWAENASFHVAHLPMRADIRAKFNETAAVEFFHQTEGLPYGYHNFLYGWIDTPRDNLPPILPNALVPVVFSAMEHFLKPTTDNFFTEGLNKRLGVEGYNITQIAALAADKQMSVQDVMAMVEQDGWIYTGEEPRDGLSYVCSAYVAAMYKAGGLFGDDEINATEFTPKDVYTLNFYDLNAKRPQACIDADPNLPYCQLLGNYRMTLPEYSTIEPYAHMNEHCPSVVPDYTRLEGC